MKIIDIHGGKQYHIRCDCGLDFFHRAPADGPFCKCPTCERSVALRELLENLEEAFR